MKNNTKKYLIYLRYLLPIVTYIAIFAMLFVPSYRFVTATVSDESVSSAELISLNWDSVRNVLFGNEEHTSAEILFAKSCFPLIIILVILLLFSLAISIWSAIAVLRWFNSEDEESAERERRLFCVFIPNRIVLTVLTSLGGAIVIFPYALAYLNTVYSVRTAVYLVAPDALIVGAILLLAIVILSVACSSFEKGFNADFFKKGTDDEKYANITHSREDNGHIDADAKERIRRLFDGTDNGSDSKDKK